MINVFNSAPSQVLSFVRQNERDKVFAVFNFSDAPQTVSFHESLCHGTYQEFFRQETVHIDSATQLTIEPWGWRVYVK